MARRKAPRPARETPAGRTALPEVQTPFRILQQVRSGEITEKQLRSEYTRLRDRARKQLNRFMEAGYDVPKEYRFFAERGKESFWKLSELKDVREITFAMADLQRFIGSKETNITGREKIDKQILQTLHKHGYTGIKKKDLRSFGKFMDKMADRMGGRKNYPSGDLAQYFSDSKTQGTRLPVNEDELEGAFRAWQAINEL